MDNQMQPMEKCEQHGGEIKALQVSNIVTDSRITRLEQNQDAIISLAASVKVIANEQTHIVEKVGDLKETIKTDVSEVNNRVSILEGKPGKKWEKFKWVVIVFFAISFLELLFGYLKTVG